MATTESTYVENQSYLSEFAHDKELAFREADGHLEIEFGSVAEWERCLHEDFPRYLPFLTTQCGLEFRGRILEVGAGACWLSAELSKIPAVTEIVATDFSPRLLKELAPRVFAARQALADKITRMPGDFHQLHFPDGHFDFVVGSAVLHHAVDLVRVLRELKRVLRPGGQLVAIREPVWPLLRLQARSHTQTKLVQAGVNEHFYTLAEWREFFSRADFHLRLAPVNLADGWKHTFNRLVNGLTHARYAFIATKPSA